MPDPLVLGDATVDVAGRALLVVPVAAVAGPGDGEWLAAAAGAGIDVLEVDGGDGSGAPALDADAVGARVRAVRQAGHLPVVVRTTRPDVVAAVRSGGGAAVDVRAAWTVPGLLDEVARFGLVVVMVAAEGAAETAAAAAGVPPDRLVVEPGAAAPALVRRPLSAWSVDPGATTGPRGLAEAAVAVVRGVRWLRVPGPHGFDQVRDALAAVEAAGAGRTGVAG